MTSCDPLSGEPDWDDDIRIKFNKPLTSGRTRVSNRMFMSTVARNSGYGMPQVSHPNPLKQMINWWAGAMTTKIKEPRIITYKKDIRFILATNVLHHIITKNLIEKLPDNLIDKKVYKKNQILKYVVDNTKLVDFQHEYPITSIREIRTFDSFTYRIMDKDLYLPTASQLYNNYMVGGKMIKHISICGFHVRIHYVFNRNRDEKLTIKYEINMHVITDDSIFDDNKIKEAEEKERSLNINTGVDGYFRTRSSTLFNLRSNIHFGNIDEIDYDICGCSTSRRISCEINMEIDKFINDDGYFVTTPLNIYEHYDVDNYSRLINRYTNK